ncbi:PAS domain S-box protein [Luteitalea sp. TBR-22]|uniref:PAS domain-containing sensor histidine kinase n=1 Tax=Luteitalea sp. TBR-22 TaxID=2802971 RepID=UPI001EF64689|nr:PAS domain S-box protein [Luteitalea sp. TBR-22]
MKDSFELIFRQSPVPMAITRRDDGTILDANDACCVLLGLSREKLLGRQSIDLGTWTDAAERAAVMEKVRTEGRVRQHETLLTSGQHVRLSFEPFTLRSDVACLLVIVEDITAWRRTEAELRQAEARWHYALEGSDSGVWDWDATTNEVFFSDRWKSMLGFAPDEIGSSLDEWSSRVHPDDIDETMALVVAHVEGRTPEYVSEHRMRAKDGTYRWILDRGQAVTRDERGRATRVVGTHTDITARRQAEERRRDEERRFRAIFDSAFQFIGLLSPDGTLLEANRTALDFAGLDAADVVGKPFWEARWWQVDAATTERLREAVAAAARGEFVRYEAVVRGRGGHLTTIDFSIKPIRDAGGRVVLLVPEGRDIGDIRRAQDELHESEERFRSAFEAAAVGMALVAPDGRMLKVNQAFCEMLGYDAEALQALTFQAITHPDDLEADLAQAARLARGDIRSYQLEKRYLHRDGRVIWIRLTGSAVRDTRGNLVHFIAQVEDVTDHRQAQQALERTLAEKDMLLREVHHRVKNNLQVVSSLLSLQRRAVQDPATGDVLDDSRRRVLAMALVHERLYQGADLAAIDMRRYLHELVRQLCQSMAPAGVLLRSNVTADDHPVPVDVALPCGLIVNELVANVLKYAFVGRTAGALDVSLTRDGDDTVLTVSDDGIGLPVVPREGSIGMRLVESLARQLHGSFQLQAHDGVRAVIRFPLHPSEASA